jgi:hypothetical protein
VVIHPLTYRLSRNTYIKTARTAISLYCAHNCELTQDSSARFVKEHAAKMGDQCIAVLQSPDPIAKCREDLGDLVYARQSDQENMLCA